MHIRLTGLDGSLILAPAADVLASLILRLPPIAGGVDERTSVQRGGGGYAVRETPNEIVALLAAVPVEAPRQWLPTDPGCPDEVRLAAGWVQQVNVSPGTSRPHDDDRGTPWLHDGCHTYPDHTGDYPTTMIGSTWIRWLRPVQP